MRGGGQTARARQVAAVLGGPLLVLMAALLLGLCGPASASAGAAPTTASTPVSAPASSPASSPVTYSSSSSVPAPAPSVAPRSGPVSYDYDPPRRPAGFDDHLVADDAGSSRCHKSRGEGGGLPAAPSAAAQQTLPLALPVCPTPESHAAIGAAHERPPVRGPAPAPPPTPVELSVLRV
ncbi:hypothetical protein MMF93_17720 [Streptomyces tubbatahanensis]|uniref:Uncharacterized protein n=1 Tax=Streptomyces tubbatahanensis TaxID=2923272 RepID=A0ABY3XUQ0_9ACTN|nr:hypothetical protein [Streptomyces tubbatahanensis]UNS98094.1 hypothetical protein MMF93_17720 [Streptomyces tubbatahanensis]